jgi:hypothetical protein
LDGEVVRVSTCLVSPCKPRKPLHSVEYRQDL